MRLLFLIVFWAFIVSFAQSSEPAKTPPASRIDQSEINTACTNPNPYAQKIEKTKPDNSKQFAESLFVIVKQIRADFFAINSNTEQKKKSTISNTDIWLIAFNGLLAIFTFGLAWMACRQNRYFSTVERAYVFIKFSHGFSTKEHVYPSGAFEKFNTTNSVYKAITIAITLLNTGKTPAQKIVHKYCIGLIDSQNQIENLEEFANVQCKGFTQKISGLIIRSDGEYIENNFPEYRVDEIVLQDITRHNRTLHIAGIIEYEDVFKIKRRTVYDWKYIWNGQRGDFVQSENVKLNYYT
jgi:hypothetical protein